MGPLVSILIPAYNAEKWIEDTIRSALDQTWSRKEIIIVNDGSSDNTLAIARQFESGSLKVVSQEKRGASAARNRAFEYAQGDYIQWLDADDLLAYNKISEQMKIAESGRTSLTLLSSSFGTFYWRPQKGIFVQNALWQDLSPVEWLLQRFRYNLWMVPAVWLVSRRLTEIAGPWNENLSLDDDGEYFCRVVAASERVKFVRQAIIYYRQSGFSQLSREYTPKSYESLLLSLTLCIRHLSSVEDSERTRRASLKLLQDYLHHFYPDKTEQLEKINNLAFKLGGELQAPSYCWKINLLKWIIGLKAANNTVNTLRKLKLIIAVKRDELLYKISRSLS
jgi:glycosyltransferase involved in cell wall biosynthesis